MCTCNKLLTLCDCDVTDCDDHAMSRNIVRFCVHNCDCYCDATAIWLRPEINVFIFLPGCTRLQPITMRERISTGMVPTLFLLSLPAHGFLVCLNSVIQTTVYICHPLYSKNMTPSCKSWRGQNTLCPNILRSWRGHEPRVPCRGCTYSCACCVPSSSAGVTVSAD